MLVCKQERLGYAKSTPHEVPWRWLRLTRLSEFYHTAHAQTCTYAQASHINIKNKFEHPCHRNDLCEQITSEINMDPLQNSTESYYKFTAYLCASNGISSGDHKNIKLGMLWYLKSNFSHAFQGRQKTGIVRAAPWQGPTHPSRTPPHRRLLCPVRPKILSAIHPGSSMFVKVNCIHSQIGNPLSIPWWLS